MVVRLATVEDMEYLVRARFDYFAAEQWDMDEATRQSIEAQLRQYYAAHLGVDFFAAFVEEDNYIVSVAALCISEKPANLVVPTGKTGTIMNVLTYPAYRRRGHAARTVSLLVEEGKRHGLSHIELMASEMGRGVYARLGFQEKEPSPYTDMRLPLVEIE